LERLKLHVTGMVRLGADGGMASPWNRFVTTEHWRLQQIYPAEVAAATRPYTDLLLAELRAAKAAGLPAPANPEYDAWLAAQLLVAVFHHYAFTESAPSPEELGEQLWSFFSGGWGIRTNGSRPVGATDE
jgi:hypothetical protein